MKRLVLCCDGTWNTADSPAATNIEKISRCVETNTDNSGDEQIVQYLRGVGTSYKIDKFLGGWLGLGLTASILDAYRWLVLNYHDGDQIFIFGFSRGAYMARSLAGMVHKVGLLKKDENFRPKLLEKAREVYKTKDNQQAALEFRREHSYPGGTPIHFLGVFDTVGALGLPAPLSIWNTSFHDVRLNNSLHNGRHALAIDERRRAFAPTLWQPAEQPAEPPASIRQVWFRGVHSDIGGGYEDTGLSDITLNWMIDEAESCGLVFDRKKVDKELSDSARSSMQPHQSMKWFYRLTNPIYGAGSRAQFRAGRRRLQLDEGTPPQDLYADARVSRSALDDPAPPKSLGAEAINVTWFRQQLKGSWSDAIESWRTKNQ